LSAIWPTTAPEAYRAPPERDAASGTRDKDPIPQPRAAVRELALFFYAGVEPSTPRRAALSFRCVRAADAAQLGDIMTILPGAGAYWFEGNEVGCLLIHGFTGTPQNVRPLADYLARRGLTVAAPRMPGHGTTAADLDSTGPEDWLAAAEQALTGLRDRCSTVFVAGISMGGTITLELARRHSDLPGVVVMAAPVLPLDALESVVNDPNRPASIPAPWATVGVLTEDVGVGGIAYLEMPLGALERGMQLMTDVREGLGDVTVPMLLIYGDADQIVDKANGPFVLGQISSSDKRLLPLSDSSHEVTLDVDRERVMVEVYDFIRERSKS
jgi:carboxylesterase